MVSVTGLLAITSAKVGVGVKSEPLAAADSASAEATPIPIPAIMDLFILLFSCNVHTGCSNLAPSCHSRCSGQGERDEGATAGDKVKKQPLQKSV